MKYYIIAGEASGDLHGSNLMKGIYAEDPQAEIRFWGGDLMADVWQRAESGSMGMKNRATPLAAGIGEWLRNSPVDCFNEPARSEGVGGVLFAADTHRMGKALIVGLGGAGKAAAAAAESLGMEVIRMNRTIKDDTTRPLDDFRECFREADIIIYNIPAAIPSLNELTDKDFATGKPKFIMEANYKNPSFDEAFINRMKEANPLAEYTGGKTWLLYQAVTGYELFTGEKPDLANMSDVL